jgi:protein phosphatase
MIKWEATVRTDPGLLRSQNEDSYLFRPEAAVYAVADGMGGHPAGDVASRMAVESLDAQFPDELAGSTDPRVIAARLAHAVERANDEIITQGLERAEFHLMGTTLTALIALDASCVIAHVGDSRAYRLRDRQLTQLTTDHTWVQEQVALGVISAFEAKRHPRANQLSRVLGMADLGQAEIVLADAAAGDVFLLCSDGLSSTVTETDLETILNQGGPLDDLADELVEAANLRGGPDNITVLLLRAESA